MQPKDYNDNFFDYHLAGALKSAEAIIPVVLNYIKPRSVLDVGCGIGAWLSVWKKNGITDIFGVDGTYVDTSRLMMDQSLFRGADLEKGFSVDKKYDLVSCLEVAEHLHEEFAESFIQLLCSAGDVILFSAAIPGQEGTQHYNEQYPEYWKILFKKSGFIAVDCLRTQLWNCSDISWWYRQNILFFVKENSLENYPKLKEFYLLHGDTVLSLIHPELFEHKLNKILHFQETLKTLL